MAAGRRGSGAQPVPPGQAGRGAGSAGPLQPAPRKAGRRPAGKWLRPPADGRNRQRAPLCPLYGGGTAPYSLFPAETAALSLWETCYCHALDGYDALAEWFRGSGMRPYLDALPDEGERSAFIRRFTERAAEEFPLAGDGRLLLWFRRLFFVAYKPEER